MDDQGQTTTKSLDDLVKELSQQKDPSVQGTNPPTIVKPPNPLTPPNPAPPPLPSSLPPKPPLPTISPPISSVPKPAPIAPLPSSSPSFAPSSIPKPFTPPSPKAPIPPTTTFSPPQVKDYQSSIRTMSGDLSNLKAGQKPSGMEMPRKVESEKPVMPAPSIIPKPTPPSLGKMPIAELGKTEKSAILNAPGRAPMPPSTNKGEQPASQIVIPESGGKKLSAWIFIAIAIVVLVFGVLYWYLILRTPTPVVVESPTPSITETPTPIPVIKLTDIFSGPVKTVSLPATGDLLAYSLQELKKEQVIGGEFKKVSLITTFNGTETVLTLGDALGRFLIAYPNKVKDNVLEDDTAILLYGQKESFDKKGKLISPVKVSERLILITEVKDALAISEAMKEWETSLPNDLNSLFELGWKQGAKTVFADNSYQGLSVRYANFPNPDKSIDYAVVTASNDKMYLVISNSRESVYATIDNLKMPVVSPSESPSVSPSPGGSPLY